MYKIRQYCVKNKIRLNKPQWNANLPLYTKKIHSSYYTKEGIMFYVRGNRRDLFIHLKFNGTFHISDGYDGGDMSRFGPFGYWSKEAKIRDRIKSSPPYREGML